MNEIQIKEEVLRYLEDENYRYALLIDGEWGSGKTYFALNGLKDAIEQHENNNQERELKYISLYGCRTVEEIEEKVLWSVIDKKFFKLKSKLLRKVFFRKSPPKKQGLSSTSKKLIDTAMHILNINYKAYEYLEDFFSFDKFIIIFDDLERANCPVNELLGYVNGLVEHERVKVVLVANEQEIGRINKIQNKELQYIVAVNEDIKIPKEDNPITSNIRGYQQKQELTIEELERRRRQLFLENEIEQQYQRLREKLIGITIHYEPNFSEVIHILVNRWNGDAYLKELLENNTMNFIALMNQYHHHNFRTFQFFLSKVEYLYHKLCKLQIDERYFKPVAGFVVQNCFMLCVEFKGNIGEPEGYYQKIVFQYRKFFKSIQIYVKTSVFEEESFNNEVTSYIQTEIMNKLPDDDPYSELYYNYFQKPQKWCEERISHILNKLEWNEYQVQLYGNILILLVVLKNVGFDSNIVSQAFDYMMGNIRTNNATGRISEDLFTTQDAEVREEVLECIRRLNDAMEENRKEYQKRSLKEMLSDKEEWSKLIQTYIDSNEFSRYSTPGFLCQVSADEWIYAILQSDPEQIQDFRKIIYNVYPEGIVQKNLFVDIPVMKQICEDLKQHDEKDDLIKRLQLSWLIKELEEIYMTQIENYERYKS